MRQFYEWGPEFQLRLLSLLIKHPADVYSIIEPGYFQDPIQVDIARVVKDAYRGKLNSQLSKSTLLGLVKSTLRKADKQYWPSYRSIIRKAFRYPLRDKDILIQQVIEFSKETQYRETLIQVEKDITNRKYEIIPKRFQELFDRGKEKDLGLIYWDGIEKSDRYRNERSEIIPTGFKTLDKYMGGGLGGGELAILLAGGKAGKSTVLANLAAAASRYGKNVAIATAELSARKYQKRIDSLITKTPAEDFHKRLVRKEVIKKLLHAKRIMKGKIFIKQYPTGKASTDDIDIWLSDLEKHGEDVHLLLVDYIFLFRPSVHVKDRRLNIGQVALDLRGIATERDIPVWAPTQGNRAALEKPVLGPQDLAEDLSMFFTTDFLVALCQTKLQRDHTPLPRARFFISASRDTGRGGIINLEMDYATYRITERKKDRSDKEESEK